MTGGVTGAAGSGKAGWVGVTGGIWGLVSVIVDLSVSKLVRTSEV